MATPVPDVVVWPNHNTVLDLSSLLGALARSLGRRVCGEARVAFSLVAAPDLDHFVGMVHEFAGMPFPQVIFRGSDPFLGWKRLTFESALPRMPPRRRSRDGEARRSARWPRLGWRRLRGPQGTPFCHRGASGVAKAYSHTMVLLPSSFIRFGAIYAWNTRIISVLHRFIERQTASAYVSTLGGGYFLCDYLGHAQRAALAQLRIAAISGDEKTVGRCLVHLAYSQIKLQRYRRAERALKVASGLATRHQDQTLATMVTAARCTIRDLRAYGALPDADPTRDDFVRLRAHTPPKEALQ